jgi:hypothetical protein
VYALCMRLEELKLVPLTGTLFALACSGAGGPQPDGATGKTDLPGDAQRNPGSDVTRPRGCVDLAWNAYPIRGGAGLWNGRLYVFWPAGKELAETSIATDGGGLSTTKRQVFPVGTDDRTKFLPSAGTYAGGYLAAAQALDTFLVVTGVLGEPGFSTTPLEISGDLGIRSADIIAWDGEAFNVELDSSDFSTWSVRLNPDGSVKQPPTKYGLMVDSSYEGYDLGYKISTNAISGVTYLFSATYPRNITGHTRDGKPLAWIPAEGVLTLPLYSGPPYSDKGIDSAGGATHPAVSADDQGGAWIAWTQSTNREHSLLGIQHIAADGALGRTMWYETTWSMAHSLLARSPDRALLLTSNAYELYLCDVIGDKLSEPRLLTVEQPHGLAETVDYREMQLLSDGSTDWLVMQQGTRSTVAVRVLKIAPGCVYPTHPTELLTL